MRSTKGNSSATQEEDDDCDEEFSAKEGVSNSKDAKNNDRANAIRSKHSVTEQRRRCKINERFQLLRDLIPHGDHKRDTASFLVEVIDYVQLLQEKVRKYEGSYHAWSAEATESMPWRRSQGLNSDSQSADGPVTTGNRRDEHTIEGGTISISSTYSQELLNTLTQTLQSSGVDLSKARISIRIDLGKRANLALESDAPHVKESENAFCNLGVAHHREGFGQEELEQAHKRLRT